MKIKFSSNLSWIIVGISFVTLAVAYGAGWYSFSVFFVALLKEFNWNRSMVAGALSLFMILHAVMSPFAGSMVDRFGPRVVFVAGSSTAAVGFVLCSLIQSWWQFYIFFGVIAAAGVGLIGWVPNTTVIQQSFRGKRGLPMGIISSGVGIGILVCIPLIQHLINRVGWRMTYRITGLFIPLIIISMVVVLLKKVPQTVVLSHGGKEVIDNVTKDHLAVNEEWTSRSWTVLQAAGTRQFWLLGVALFLINVIIHSVLAHHVAFFVDQGLTALSASYIAGTIGIVSIGAKVFWGMLSDKIGREITFSIGIACSVCGMIFLIAFTRLAYSYLPYFYAISFGSGYAIMAFLPSLIVADFFQGRAYGSIYGTLFMFGMLGGAFGVWFAGFVYDRTSSYVPVFFTMIACAIVACYSTWKAGARKIRVVPREIGKVC